MGRLPWLIMLACGGGGFIVLVPLALGGLEFLVDKIVASQTQLNEGSPTWKIWQKVPIKIYMRVYIFNITNPEEVKKGAKPILKEMGPYTYLETLEKVDIAIDEESDTVRYRQVHTYFFQPELSSGSEDDLVTFINIPLVGVAKMAHDFTDEDFMLTGLDSMLTDKGETLTRTHKVRELLFDGFSVQAFLDLLNDPVVEASGADIKVPTQIMNGKMGILEGKNGTDDGWYVVFRGKLDSKDFGRVVTWNGKEALEKFNHSSCNAINGTDGMLFQPFITKDLNLQFVIPLMCRSLTYVNTETVTNDGVTCYRYRMDPVTFQGLTLAPQNWCFCGDKNLSSCNINGVFSLAACTEGAPLYISNPHFWNGEPSLLNAVEGMKPNPDIHQGYFDIHPVSYIGVVKTGISVQVRHRFQFNIAIQPWEAMPTFQEVPVAILPILWLEEGGDIDETNKGLVYLLDTSMGIWTIVKWILLLLFAGMAGAGVALYMLYKKESKSKVQVQLIEKDNASAVVDKAN